MSPQPAFPPSGEGGRSYHRKDGRLVKLVDDLLSASRYAMMMLRFAEGERTLSDWRRPIRYPPNGLA